jgi:hypothetical protein
MKNRAMFLTKHIAALIQPMDQGTIQASMAFYRGELLGGVVNSKLQIMKFLETLTLKDVAYSVDLTWRKVCWKRCHRRQVKVNSILNPRHEAAYSTLNSNLVADDLAASPGVDMATQSHATSY